MLLSPPPSFSTVVIQYLYYLLFNTISTIYLVIEVQIARSQVLTSLRSNAFHGGGITVNWYYGDRSPLGRNTGDHQGPGFASRLRSHRPWFAITFCFVVPFAGYWFTLNAPSSDVELLPAILCRVCSMWWKWTIEGVCIVCGICLSCPLVMEEKRGVALELNDTVIKRMCVGAAFKDYVRFSSSLGLL